jgi:hypothetical protein
LITDALAHASGEALFTGGVWGVHVVKGKLGSKPDTPSTPPAENPPPPPDGDA